jgi:hypothetical protein
MLDMRDAKSDAYNNLTFSGKKKQDKVEVARLSLQFAQHCRDL